MDVNSKDAKIPYRKLQAMCAELEEENAFLRSGLDHLRDEADRYSNMVDVLIDVLKELKSKANLPF